MDISNTTFELVACLGSGFRKSLNLWVLLNAEIPFVNTPIFLCSAQDREDSYEPLEHILKIDNGECTVNLKSAFLALPFEQIAYLPEADDREHTKEPLGRYEQESIKDTERFCDIAIEKIMNTFIHASKRNLCDKLHVPLFDLDRNHTIHIKDRAYSLNTLYQWRNRCLEGFYDGSQFSTGVKNFMSWHTVGRRSKKDASPTRQKPQYDVHRPPKFKSTSLDYLRDNESWLSIALRGRRRLTLTVNDKEGDSKDLAPYWDKRAVSKKVLSTWVMIIVFAGVLVAGGGLCGGLVLFLVFSAPYIDFFFKH